MRIIQLPTATKESYVVRSKIFGSSAKKQRNFINFGESAERRENE